jgi:glucosyl-3-phosphoglycerate synthase
MSDFHQYATIATLHGLHEIHDPEEYLAMLETRLEDFAKRMQIALVLPCHHSELEHPEILDSIVEQIRGVRYLRQVVIAYNGTDDPADFAEAKEFFARLRTEDREVRLVWVDGPRVQGVLRSIAELLIDTGGPGKGQSVWITFGYAFARDRSDVIALHDCDILTYDRTLLGRLIEPTANPDNDLEFSKGYYGRVSTEDLEMKGRTTRIFVAPFVETLADLMRRVGDTRLEDFFRYLRSFRYPLSGEFSFVTRLARSVNIANDWSLETATLADVYQRVSLRKVAQVDLARNYDHRHKPVYADPPSSGLQRMVIDITKFLLLHLRQNGQVLGDDFIEMLQHTYRQNAWYFIKKYAADAASNGLAFARHSEELTASYFARFIGEAWGEIREGKIAGPIPSWNRVSYSFPGIYGDILAAVEADNG